MLQMYSLLPCCTQDAHACLVKSAAVNHNVSHVDNLHATTPTAQDFITAEVAVLDSNPPSCMLSVRVKLAAPKRSRLSESAFDTSAKAG